MYSNHRRPQNFHSESKSFNFHSVHDRGSNQRPFPSKKRLPNFTIELSCREDTAGFRRDQINGLIHKLNFEPNDFDWYNSGNLAGKLFFREWVRAKESMVRLWGLRFDGDSFFDPILRSNVLLPSDNEELDEELKCLFGDRVRGFITGDSVKEWRSKLGCILNEMADVSKLLSKGNRIRVCNELLNKRTGLISEKDRISKRLKEFKSTMECILRFIDGEQSEEGGADEYGMFYPGGDLCWSRVYYLIMREQRRFIDGLPIYAFRKEILQIIRSQQITVLIGETGSGKSTQLVQFLADSGVASSESIVCTQPRKIAAISLARRVAEESCGCYDDKSIIWCPATLSTYLFKSKIIYTTDHCLLQYYMKDKKLSGISCIIVDEAHERSLNTDLLLALLKGLLLQNRDLRLIIMSATADANQLSNYFFGCGTFHVVGRSFPVDVKYVPSTSTGISGSGPVASYVSNALRMVSEIHKTEKEGSILAFLTSQIEVEWACENFESPTAVCFPLHGKLSLEEQFHVFQHYPGKRKVIFCTNVAETSLTIPGIKYVVDSGMVKESRFEPGSGMNVLKIYWTNKSSANQRSGRSGRTEPGVCYRLYSKSKYELMPPQQDPEIRRVHLGVAVLRIIALGINNVQNFDFIDAPSSEAIDMAIRNLIQLEAIRLKNENLEITETGRYMVKLGIEPRLGKLILGCFYCQLGREGVVLASVMANASSIFCRVGKDEDKLKSDSLKVQFCHSNGDLFTLLSVYMEWECLPQDKQNKWCWDNSINAKSMRRCHETVIELEQCLKNELYMIIPSYWNWNPHHITEHDKRLKKVILYSLAENVAFYSGYDRLGYEVAISGQNIQLHPSCSLLMFSEKPQCVVFSEILSSSSRYLVCVTSVDLEFLSTLNPPPVFDVSKIENRRLHVRMMTGFGNIVLKKLCGRSNTNLCRVISHIQTVCKDLRIGIDVNVDQNEILVYAPSHVMEKALRLLNDALECEQKWLRNECTEKYLYHGGSGGLPPVALFGAGALIKHLELGKRYLTVDVHYSSASSIDDKELFSFLEKHTSGDICGVYKLPVTGQCNEDKYSSCRITFVTPEAAVKAFELNGFEFNGSVLSVSSRAHGFENRMLPFPAVNARVYWPRRRSNGFAIVKCHPQDVGYMVEDFSNIYMQLPNGRCEPSNRSEDAVVISGLNKDLSENEILRILKDATNKRILNFSLVRGDPFDTLPCAASEEALFRAISPFMPKGNSLSNCCRIQVFPSEPKDCFVRGMISFDGRLHLEAANALEQIEGKVLPGCLTWQKIKCQQLFHSSLSCPASIYSVIRTQLESLLACFRHKPGVECFLKRNENGWCRVKISANATKTVADLRRPIENLMKGSPIKNPMLTHTVRQLLFSRDGTTLMKTIQQQTGTFILFDRHTLDIKVFGSPDNVHKAESNLTESLTSLHESKLLEIPLRGADLPADLMKKVVKSFGPELHGLKEKVPDAEFTLNTRRHTISFFGKKDLKPKVEEIVYGIVPDSPDTESPSCPICLCEVEDAYKLESCAHSFCRPCLAEQCESAIRTRTFPICCTREVCGDHILLSDLKSLMSNEKLEDLFRASLGSYVSSSGGELRFCPSPDCPAVYRAADAGTEGEPFLCGACYVATCTSCHFEYHPYISCERYKDFKEDPDTSLKEWCMGKEHVKKCPVCGYVIEKGDGCNHIECLCGRHICWNCLECFETSDDCYNHLRSVHQAII